MASNEVDRSERVIARLAWLNLFVAAGLIGVFVVVVRLAVHGESSAAKGLFDVFNVSAVVLVVGSAFVVARVAARGKPWQRALAPGYGSIGAGAVVLMAAAVADIGWREGVEDPQGIVGLLAPTRVLMVLGLVLVACGPLRAALRSADSNVPRWAAVLSASLVLSAMLLPGGYHPAANPWLERAPTVVTGELRVMDGDGSHQTRLILPSGRDMPWLATWSPDNSRIAYTRVRVGDHSPLNDDYDIWVAAADGTDARPLVQGEGFQWLPHWSPDGVWIVYTNEPQGGPWMASGPAGLEGGGGLLGPGSLFGQPAQVRQYAHIWRVRADGMGPPEQLTVGIGDDRAATYSPDGTRLAFDSARDGTTRVYVMDADGSNPRRLTGGGDDWGATWSPDGRWITYGSWSPGLPGRQIWVMAADGSQQTQITNTPGPHSEPSWSPDGSRIAFTYEFDGTQSIWSVTREGTDPKNLSKDPRAGLELISGGGAWAKDGRIVYSRGAMPPAIADGLVRQDLAATALLVTAFLVALVAVMVARIRPPFGAFTAILVISTLLVAITSDGWRFVPAAVVGGLLVDLAIRLTPPRWKAVAAGAGLAAALVLGAEATEALMSGLSWSLTLMAGVAAASLFIGCLLGVAVGRVPSGTAGPVT